jgi:hypothetical protein
MIPEDQQDSAYIELTEFIMNFRNLRALNLKALRIGDNLGDML